MKKNYLFILLLILLFSFNVMGTELFDNIIETADVEYGQGEGEGSYRTLIFESVDGTSIDDGLEHYFYGSLGLSEQADFYGSLYSEENYTRFDMNLKYSFYNKNNWEVSGVGRYYYKDNNSSETKTPSVRLLTNYTVADRLVLHNNLRLYFYESNDMGKGFESGLTYTIDKKTRFRAILDSFTYDQLSDLTHDITLALDHDLTEKSIYTGVMYKEFDKENIYLKNQLEYNVSSGLVLIGSLNTNTKDTSSNSIEGVIEKDLNEKFSVVGELYKTLEEDSKTEFSIGFDFEL